jgi:hypothetical protein
MAVAAIIATACTLVSGVGWVLGLIFGHIALHQLKRQPEPKQKGRGLALAAAIIGWLIVAIAVLVIGLILAVVVGASNSAADEISAPAPTVIEVTPTVTEPTPPVIEPTPSTPPSATTPPAADNGLGEIVNQPDIAGFVGPFVMTDGTQVAVVSRSGPDVVADGTVELAVERSDGWDVEQTLPAGIVTAPIEVGDVTQDGVPEIKVLMLAMTGGKGWDVLYTIDPDALSLREVPFDTDALAATGMDAMSLHIVQGAVDRVETTVGTCTPSCAEDTGRPVSWTLDRTADWTLRPVEDDVPSVCTSAAFESDTGVSTRTATCADGWAVGVQADCFGECEGEEVFRLEAGHWVSVGYHYVVYADSLSATTGMPLETAAQLAWMPHSEDAASGVTTLRPGDTGSEVTAFQQALADLGYAIDVDGTFGAGTEGAVRDFQQDSGFELVDGIAGPETLGALGLGASILD